MTVFAFTVRKLCFWSAHVLQTIYLCGFTGYMNNIDMSVTHMNNAHICHFRLFLVYNPSRTSTAATNETVKSAISAAGMA